MEEPGGDTGQRRGDSSIKKSGGEDGERRSHGWRGGLEHGGLGCCCFKMIRLGSVYKRPLGHSALGGDGLRLQRAAF